MLSAPIDVLSRYWGYDSFRECQAEIIDSVLDGHDTIGLLPTGGGKSITFQVPAMLLSGLTLVVTPLISLMKDQVDNLRQRGIYAGCLHSGMTRAEQNHAIDRLYAGRTRILYVAPERLASKRFLSDLRNWDVQMIVVDEAHCISQWGYDFRPSYLHIADIREEFPDATMLALTATATPAVVTDIADKLGMKRPAIFKRSFSRPNISYVVRRTDDKDGQLLHILQNTAGTAIVYVRSRRRTEALAELIRSFGISAEAYHAGIDPDEKELRQDRWRNNTTRVVVATNAFGMGIDKPDVRVVVHYDIPPSLEEYYQEAGRAGRDGEESFAVMLVSQPDKGVLSRRINQQFPSREYIRTVYEKLGNFLQVPIGGGYEHTYACDTDRFCRNFHLEPRMTASALRLLTQAEVITYGEEPSPTSRIMVTVDKRELYDIRLDPQADRVLHMILRYYAGLFADFVAINESLIAKAAEYSLEDTHQCILRLARQRVIAYVPRRLMPYVHYPASRIEPQHVLIPRSIYEDMIDRAAKRMEAIRDYAFSDEGCRVERMLVYFGESDPKPCGKCDQCRARLREANAARRATTLSQQLDDIIASRPDGFTPHDIRHAFPSRYDEAITDLRRRVEENTLKFDGFTFFLPIKEG